MQCKDCKYWQGHKHSQWGDCYRVIQHLSRGILTANLVIGDDVVVWFQPPFDPHEVKYWQASESFKKEYKKLLKMELPDGIRKLKQRRDDIKYDAGGGERVGRVTLHFFQTRRDYGGCDAQ